MNSKSRQEKHLDLVQDTMLFKRVTYKIMSRISIYVSKIRYSMSKILTVKLSVSLTLQPGIKIYDIQLQIYKL